MILLSSRKTLELQLIVTHRFVSYHDTNNIHSLLTFEIAYMLIHAILSYYANLLTNEACLILDNFFPRVLISSLQT